MKYKVLGERNARPVLRRQSRVDGETEEYPNVLARAQAHDPITVLADAGITETLAWHET